MNKKYSESNPNTQPNEVITSGNRAKELLENYNTLLQDVVRENETWRDETSKRKVRQNQGS